jgi:transposase
MEVRVSAELTDAEWALIAPLLPAERGRPGRPSLDNRTMLDAMLWLAREGARWRALPERFGRWNTVWRRFSRWAGLGVFDALFEALAGCGLADERLQMLDSTVVRAHQHAAGARKRGRPTRRSGAARAASRPSSTSAATPPAYHSPSR